MDIYKEGNNQKEKENMEDRRDQIVHKLKVKEESNLGVLNDPGLKSCTEARQMERERNPRVSRKTQPAHTPEAQHYNS